MQGWIEGKVRLMQFLCTTNDLVSGLQTVGKAVSSRASLPILTGILFDAGAGRLGLTASDLDVSIETTVPASIVEPGRSVIPARYITELARKLPPADVRFTTEPDGGSVKIEVGRAEYRINTMDPDEFPAFPECKGKAELEISPDTFSGLARLSTFAAATDESRPFLSGVLMEISPGELTMVATDTFRLSIAHAKQDGITGEMGGVIVPAKVISEVARLSGGLCQTIKVAIDDTQIGFSFEFTRVTARLIEGKFPNYRLVIPDHYLARMRVSVKPLLEAVDRVSVLAKNDADAIGQVRLYACEGVLVITANTPDLGGAREEIQVSREGRDAEVVLRARYLLEALKALEQEDAVLDITGAGSPVCVRDRLEGGSYTHLIMPVVTD
ncbi:MAG TPA: DNA polymerase III subunit beta [Firmicutes bacterium]|nr:DNA polymerase III subunit beta [Bacillota bacterium]